MCIRDSRSLVGVGGRVDGFDLGDLDLVTLGGLRGEFGGVLGPGGLCFGLGGELAVLDGTDVVPLGVVGV